MKRMPDGDTLIIEGGTYTVAAKQIDRSHYSPKGELGLYTKIKARNIGEVYLISRICSASA